MLKPPEICQLLLWRLLSRSLPDISSSNGEDWLEEDRPEAEGRIAVFPRRDGELCCYLPWVCFLTRSDLPAQGWCLPVCHMDSSVRGHMGHYKARHGFLPHKPLATMPGPFSWRACLQGLHESAQEEALWAFSRPSFEALPCIHNNSVFLPVLCCKGISG